ncbi:MAG: hypothetical protein AVDCRST_MAG61-964, partial [uncultured Friedmanniella sp.]
HAPRAAPPVRPLRPWRRVPVVGGAGSLSPGTARPRVSRVPPHRAEAL